MGGSEIVTLGKKVIRMADKGSFKFPEPHSSMLRTVLKFSSCLKEVVSLQASFFKKEAVLLDSGYPCLGIFSDIAN